MTGCFRKVTKKQKHVLINIHELSFYHSRNQSRIFFTCSELAIQRKTLLMLFSIQYRLEIYSSEFLSRMKHESGTETVGRRKTLTVGHCALVLYWFDAMYPIMKMKWVFCLMLWFALCCYRPLPLHPSLVRSFHPLQVSWRWSWTADWCKMITGVWGRAWRTTNERPIASVFCWRGGAAVERWVLTGRGYKWTKPKSDFWLAHAILTT